MEILIKVDARKVLAAFASIPGEARRELRPTMGKEMVAVQHDAQQHHRFQPQSGDLQKSVQNEIDSTGLVGKVYLDRNIAHYGYWVHQGHGSWAPDRFLFQAFERRRQRILEALEQALGRVLRKAGFR